MDIRQRLHLSGMDSHAPELARKWGLGLEVTDFCYAPMLDDPATLPAVREKMAGIDHFWLHAPFAELAPCAVDPLVREVTARRYRQALSAARQLGIRRSRRSRRLGESRRRPSGSRRAQATKSPRPPSSRTPP